MRKDVFIGMTSLCVLVAVAACSSVESGQSSLTGPGPVLSTGGNACTVEWAQFRAERGHRYKGQCAGMENEAAIIEVHEYANAIYDSEQRQGRYREADRMYKGVSSDLESQRAQLESYRAHRSQMDEATRKKYDDAVARTDNAIEVIDAASDINKTEMAAAKAKARKRQADQMGQQFEKLQGMPPEFWREALSKEGYSEEQQDRIIAFFSKFGRGLKASEAQDAASSATGAAPTRP
jgi:hypothetical protein